MTEPSASPAISALNHKFPGCSCDLVFTSVKLVHFPLGENRVNPWCLPHQNQGGTMPRNSRVSEPGAVTITAQKPSIRCQLWLGLLSSRADLDKCIDQWSNSIFALENQTSCVCSIKILWGLLKRSTIWSVSKQHKVNWNLATFTLPLWVAKVDNLR